MCALPGDGPLRSGCPRRAYRVGYPGSPEYPPVYITLSHIMIDCCVAIQVPGAGLRLEECSEVVDLGAERLQLYSCPPCGALWMARETCRGHGEWVRGFTRTNSRQAFDAQVNAARNRAPRIVDRDAAKQVTAADVARAIELAQELGGQVRKNE